MLTMPAGCMEINGLSLDYIHLTKIGFFEKTIPGPSHLGQGMQVAVGQEYYCPFLNSGECCKSGRREVAQTVCISMRFSRITDKTCFNA